MCFENKKALIADTARLGCMIFLSFLMVLRNSCKRWLRDVRMSWPLRWCSILALYSLPIRRFCQNQRWGEDMPMHLHSYHLIVYTLFCQHSFKTSCAQIHLKNSRRLTNSYGLSRLRFLFPSTSLEKNPLFSWDSLFWCCCSLTSN